MAYQAQINIKTTGLAGLNKINASVYRINKAIIQINKGGSKIKGGKEIVKINKQELEQKQKILKVETDIDNQLKIQKTLPKEGYHQWHIEHMRGAKGEPRAFAFSVYLNDVEEGGETEFLHFSQRIKPKQGRVVIWPAAFPYVHRGNPPLSGEKYILTSWMNLRGV